MASVVGRSVLFPSATATSSSENSLIKGKVSDKVRSKERMLIPGCDPLN